MWDWRWPISDIRREIRDARAQGKSATTLDLIETLLDQLTDTYQRLENEDLAKIDGHEIQSGKVEHFERYLSFLFDRASHYNTVIIAGAYVAFFTVWAVLSQTSPNPFHAVSALLVLASLIIFVCWEVGLSVYMARTIRAEAQLFLTGGKEYLEKKQQQESEVRRRKINIIPIWYLILLATIGLGLAGAGSFALNVALELVR